MLLVRIEAYGGGHMINGSFSSGPSPELTVVISPVLECIMGIELLSNWQNAHLSSLICGVRAIKVGKERWKILELPLPTEQVN